MSEFPNEAQLNNLTIEERARYGLPVSAEDAGDLHHMITQLEKRLDDLDLLLAESYAEGRRDAAKEIRDLLEKFDE